MNIEEKKMKLEFIYTICEILKVESLSLALVTGRSV